MSSKWSRLGRLDNRFSEITVLGPQAQELAAKLLAIPEDIRKVIETRAMEEANACIEKELKERAPEDTGQLKNSITTSVKTYQNGRIQIGIIGPRSSYQKTGLVKQHRDYIGGKSGVYQTELVPYRYKRDGVLRYKRMSYRVLDTYEDSGLVRNPASSYAHLVEHGTVQRETKFGENRGRTRATHFAYLTLISTEEKVVEIFQRILAEEINKIS